MTSKVSNMIRILRRDPEYIGAVATIASTLGIAGWFASSKSNDNVLPERRVINDMPWHQNGHIKSYKHKYHKSGQESPPSSSSDTVISSNTVKITVSDELRQKFKNKKE